MLLNAWKQDAASISQKPTAQATFAQMQMCTVEIPSTTCTKSGGRKRLGCVKLHVPRNRVTAQSLMWRQIVVSGDAVCTSALSSCFLCSYWPKFVAFNFIHQALHISYAFLKQYSSIYAILKQWHPWCHCLKLIKKGKTIFVMTTYNLAFSTTTVTVSINALIPDMISTKEIKITHSAKEYSFLQEYYREQYEPEHGSARKIASKPR